MTLLPSRMVWSRLVRRLAVGGGLDPEAELADLDGLGVEVHAVEVVLEDLAVEVEEGALAAQFLEAGVGDFVERVELVEGFDEERAAAAGRDRGCGGALSSSCQASQNRIEGLALRLVERGEVVGVGIGRALCGRCRWLRPRAAGAGFRSGACRTPPERLFDDVAGDEGRGVEGAFLFAAGSSALRSR